VSQVIQVTRDSRTGRISNVTFFKEFYDADIEMQLSHLKNLREIAEVCPGDIKVIEDDSKPSNEPTD